MPNTRPNDLSSDPDAVMSAAGPATRTLPEPVQPVTGDAPDNDASPISPLKPASMHRADRDDEVRATSPDFSEHPAGTAHDGSRDASLDDAE